MICFDDIQGHWVRHWIKAPGFEDHTTRVHWMQVGELYADLRVPLERPDLSGATTLSDLAAGALGSLAAAEGFAGHVTLEGSVCTWHREINWHGTPETVDAGTISFDTDGRLVETGVHSDYTELWERDGREPGRAVRFSGEGYSGHLVVRGESFVLAIGRPEKPATAPLIAALDAGRVPDGIDVLFDGLHAMGRWSGNQAIAQLATQPFAEGKSVVTLHGSGITWSRISFDGTESEVAMELEPALE